MADLGTQALGLIEKVAPALASAIGGPLAGLTTRAICAAIGLPEDSPPAALNTAMAAATPDQLLALKQADRNFIATMRQLDINLARIDTGDSASARARQAMMHDSTPAVLAYALTIGFFGLIWLMAFRPVPTENAAAINILLGTLGTAWIAAMSYYFGSTQGSRAKTEMLFQSTPASGLARQPAPIAQAIQIEQPQDDAPRRPPQSTTRVIDQATAIGEETAHASQ